MSADDDTARKPSIAPGRLNLCEGGHRTIRQGTDSFRAPEGFDFGRGHTSVDRLVVQVTSGSEPGYAEQWSSDEWAAAFECSLQLEDLDGRLCPCAPVPEWLPDVVAGRIQFSYDLPYPAIGMIEDSAVDWFALHDAHPNRWNLDIPWDNAPTLDGVRAGLELARSLGGTPELWTDLAPRGADAVLTTVTGMNVVWPTEAAAMAHEETISAHYAGTSTYVNGRTPQNERGWLWC